MKQILLFIIDIVDYVILSGLLYNISDYAMQSIHPQQQGFKYLVNMNQ